MPSTGASQDVWSAAGGVEYNEDVAADLDFEHGSVRNPPGGGLARRVIASTDSLRAAWPHIPRLQASERRFGLRTSSAIGAAANHTEVQVASVTAALETKCQAGENTL